MISKQETEHYLKRKNKNEEETNKKKNWVWELGYMKLIKEKHLKTEMWSDPNKDDLLKADLYNDSGSLT